MHVGRVGVCACGGRVVYVWGWEMGGGVGMQANLCVHVCVHACVRECVCVLIINNSKW